MSAALVMLPVGHINMYSFYVRCIGNVACMSYKYIHFLKSATLAMLPVCLKIYSNFISAALVM